MPRNMSTAYIGPGIISSLVTPLYAWPLCSVVYRALIVMVFNIQYSQLSPVLDYMKQKKLEYSKRLVHVQDGILHGEKENLLLKEIFYITTNQTPRLAA